MDMQHLEGSIVALVTPFNDDGSVDFEALDRLIEFQIENGTDGILTLGTTGESSTMSHEEDNEVCRFVVEHVGGRVPVIAGSGSNSTETMLEKSLAYQKIGVDGLLIITPYYNKANEEGIYRHLATVADGVDIPCILYNIPGRCGCSISAANMERLAQHPQHHGRERSERKRRICREYRASHWARVPHVLGRGRHRGTAHVARRERRHLGLGECAARARA